LRSHDLIVDAPPGVVVERLTAERPPRIRARDLSGIRSHDVDPSEFVEPAIEVRAFLRQETCALQVALPVLQVELAMGDVEVAGEDDVSSVGAQFGDALGGRVEPRELLGHLRRRCLVTGVGVRGDDGDRLAAAIAEVGLDPATIVGECRRVTTDAVGGDRTP
jgi:hypothetical protein